MDHKSLLHRWLLVLDKSIIRFTFIIILTITLTIMLLLLLLLCFGFSGVNTYNSYVIIIICNSVVVIIFMYFTNMFIFHSFFPQKASNHSM